MNDTLITAHAGAEGTPANTLESVRALASCGADAVEVDVRRLGGRLILSHDVPEAGEPCPLKDCLRVVAGHPNLKVNLDLKHSGQVREILALARTLGVTEQILITGEVGAEDIPAIREGNLTVWYNNSLIPEGVDPIRGAANMGFDIVNLCWKDVTEVLPPARLSLWTVDDEATLARLMGRGFRNITTNAPRRALILRGMIRRFHEGWDAFPGAARLVDRQGFVLAANDRARRAGFAEGVRCVLVKTENRHHGCLLRRAFESGQGQFDVSEGGMLRAWVPVAEWDGAVLHFSYKH